MVHIRLAGANSTLLRLVLDAPPSSQGASESEKPIPLAESPSAEEWAVLWPSPFGL